MIEEKKWILIKTVDNLYRIVRYEIPEHSTLLNMFHTREEALDHFYTHYTR